MRKGHGKDGLFHLNINLIEKIVYFPKKEYIFYTLKRKGELKYSFLGIFKKYYEKDTYYHNDFGYHGEIDFIEFFTDHPRLYVDSEDKKIYCKPYLVLRFASGEEERIYPESEQDAIDFINKLKDNLNLTTNLW